MVAQGEAHTGSEGEHASGSEAALGHEGERGLRVSYPNPAQCDVCGVFKRETNDWFIAQDGFADGSFHISASPWKTELGLTRQHDICSESCLHKFVSAKLRASKSHEGAPENPANKQRGESEASSERT